MTPALSKRRFHAQEDQLVAEAHARLIEGLQRLRPPVGPILAPRLAAAFGPLLAWLFPRRVGRHILQDHEARA